MTVTPNLDLLDAVVAHIEAHPDQHNQSEWFCGTTACVAGHAALMSGWKPVLSGSPTAWVTKDGAVRLVDVVAIDVLGLDEDTADELFDPDNSVDDIRRIQAELHAANHQADGGAA